ncbi:methyltransferase domain-containing protein [Methanoculleus sp. 7T]|uniref:methyltransferase domain-containing protein n=1 Tax=Methanoculleus sp. 7T TaxID=2937282 RepID=UPI0020BEDC3A|nr:class I SAM-dependent methyltransferase [Methanoculleus sp. 7T]MCK8517528.1 class I SAM-dependent methyltransferase [Methanoculleus sp. 7T]
MPSSRFEHISDVISVISNLKPKTFLDVGCGFGRWGFLTREFCDIFQGRYDKTSWETHIDAVEVFENYIMPHHEFIYDNVYIAKIEDYIPKMSRYDIIFAGDVIEHIEKNDANKVINNLREKCDKALMIALPLDDKWPQGEVFDNPNEIHKSVWTERDLKKLGASFVKIYTMKDDRLYAFAIWTDCPVQEYLSSSKTIRSRVIELGNKIIKRIP